MRKKYIPIQFLYSWLSKAENIVTLFIIIKSKPGGHLTK